MVINPIAGHVQCSAKTNTQSMVTSKTNINQTKLSYKIGGNELRPPKTVGNKLGLSSAKLSKVKFGCLEVFFEVVFKDNLKLYEHCLNVDFD